MFRDQLLTLTILYWKFFPFVINQKEIQIFS